MPAEHRVDPTLRDAVAAQVTRASHAAVEASHELLAHYGDIGDAPAQRAVDTLIDHAADALRALADSLADSSRELQATTLRASTHHHGEADGSSARSGRRRDHRA
jgi:hypothetical protein